MAILNWDILDLMQCLYGDVARVGAFYSVEEAGEQVLKKKEIL